MELPDNVLDAPRTRKEMPSLKTEAQIRKVSEEPSGYRRWFDSSWDTYVSYWVHRAEDTRSAVHDKRQRHIAPVISSKDWDRLERLFETIRSRTQQYNHTLKVMKESEKAREIARTVRKAVLAYEAQERLSEAQAKRISDPPNAYKNILNKRIKELSFRWSEHTVQAANKKNRETAFRAIIAWLNGTYPKGGGPPGPRVFWLKGERGCGKSVMAHTLAEMLEKRHALAAGFIFTNKLAAHRVLTAFMISLSVEVAKFLGSSFEATLMDVIEQLDRVDGDAFYDWKMVYQLQALLVPAYRRVPPSDREPLMIVLDGIDKLTDHSKVPDLLSMMKASIDALPIHYVITSTNNEYVDSCIRVMLEGELMEFELESYKAEETPTQANFNIPQPPPTDDTPEPVYSGELAGAFQDRDLGLEKAAEDGGDDGASVYYDASSVYEYAPE